MHGIPNTPVDIYANGKKILSGFTFKTVAGPLQLPAGSYAIDVRKAGSAAASAPVLSATEQVTAGENATIVAGLTASGTPVLTAFANDTSAAGAGKGRLLVRHVAEAPAVDVYAGSSKVISGLASGQQQALDVPAGTVSAKVTLAGQTAAVLGPVNVPVTAGMGIVVYAIGSAAGHTLTAITQQYPLAVGYAVTRPPGHDYGAVPPPGIYYAGTSSQGVTAAHPGAGRGGGTAGRSAATPDVTAVRVPVRLLIPAIGVSAPVLPTGVQAGGSLAIPPDPSDVGWWAGGGFPGEPAGAVILGGHQQCRPRPRGAAAPAGRTSGDGDHGRGVRAGRPLPGGRAAGLRQVGPPGRGRLRPAGGAASCRRLLRRSVRRLDRPLPRQHRCLRGAVRHHTLTIAPWIPSCQV